MQSSFTYLEISKQYNLIFQKHNMHFKIENPVLTLSNANMWRDLSMATRTNNVSDYKLTFKQYKKDQYNYRENKPLCVIAISKAHDYNGALLSDVVLMQIKKDIKRLSTLYKVVPIMFKNKYDLEQKLRKYKRKHGPIKLLCLESHGSCYTLHGFFAQGIKDTHISNLSHGTQIAINACSTAGRNIFNSFAARVAYDNPGCEVFASRSKITHSEMTFTVDKNGQPKLASLCSHYCNTKRVSYKMYVKPLSKSDNYLSNF